MAAGKHSRGTGLSSKRNLAILITLLVVIAVCIYLAAGSLLFQSLSRYEPPANRTGVWNRDISSSASSASASASANVAASASTEQARTIVQELIAPYGTDVVVNVMPLDGTPGFSLNGNRRLIAASMIKLLILAEFMDEVDAGVRSLDSTYTLSADDIVGGTGKLQNDAPGSTYTYDELARYMIAYSDNTATNILIDSMGMSKINEKAAELGLSATQLQRRMMDLDSGVENYISADDAATILYGIANHTIASDAMCTKAESYLQAQVDSDGLAQGVPSSVPFGHKTGSLDSVRHDGGIVYANNRYVIVVLTSLNESTANALMAQISDAVYNAMGNNAAG